MTSNTCITTPSGQLCTTSASSWASCKPWQLTHQPSTNCYADSLIQESLNIAGAIVNVYKLLGIHEQTRLVDVSANGTAISGGYETGYDASNAFTSFKSEWRSAQHGDGVISTSYIGYDFGVVKIPSGRPRYGIPANVRVHITTIRIKQGANPLNRISKARVERSDDGIGWYGVAIINVPVDDVLNTIHFKQSTPSRYWRLRPISFVGGGCDGWSIQALELIDYAATATDNIQDQIFMENRDRDYDMHPQVLKGSYDLINTATDMTRFGFDLPTQNFQIKINFNACVALLNRPIIIGDIIELPSETQYTPSLQPIKKYIEVTDVSWDTTSYTPGWVPTMLLISTQSAQVSQETQSVFGDLAAQSDTSGLFNNDDSNNQLYQDFSAIDQTISADANTAVPEKGSEGSNSFREFTPEELTTVPYLETKQFGRTGLYVEDAIPQNGAPFSEGTTFPHTPNDGDYHRLTYEGVAKDVPARLYRWSDKKMQWIYLETDRRAQYNNSRISEYTTSPNKISASKIK